MKSDVVAEYDACPSSALVGRGIRTQRFEARMNQANDLTIYICRFLARRSPVLGQHADWLD